MKFFKDWELKYEGNSLRVFAAEVDHESVNHCLTQLEIMQEQVDGSSGCWRTRMFLAEHYNGIGGEVLLSDLTDLLKDSPQDYPYGEYEIYQELYRKYLEVLPQRVQAI